MFIKTVFLPLTENSGQIPQSASTKAIYGIIGLIRLIAGPYLVVITGKKHVGQINGQDVWEVTNTEVISCTRTLLHLTEKQVENNFFIIFIYYPCIFSVLYQLS